MLPSEKGFLSKCKRSYSEDGELTFNEGELRLNTDGHKDWWENQHLYILSDEEIKEGDWFIHISHGITELLQCKSSNEKELFGETNGDKWVCWRDYSKKIIATTDTELHYNKIVEEDMHMYKESLLQIPQHIIEAYVKNPFDEVEVEYGEHLFESSSISLKGGSLYRVFYRDDKILCGEGYFSHIERNQVELHFTQDLNDVEDYYDRYKHIFKEVVYKPKLNQDGTLAVSLVEEKMYSREEVEELCRNSHLLGMKETLPGYPKPETIDEWIKENL